MSQAPALDELLDKAVIGLDGALRRMERLLPKDTENWELEHEAFGIEDPAIVRRRLLEEERPGPPTPDSPVPRGRLSWRELFRRNWPDGKPRKRWRPRW